jgi:Leucine-rich repeat (LRR) protein
MLRNKDIQYFDDNKDKYIGIMMDELVNIECLLVSHNVLRSINGIQKLTTLLTLNLSFNYITELNGIENLTLLEDLHVNNNRILMIEPIASLKNLKALGFFNNELVDQDVIVDTLASLPKLTELCIDGNPATRNLEFHYTIVLKIPKLTMLNEEPVKELDTTIATKYFENKGMEVPEPDAQKDNKQIFLQEQA